MYVGDTWVNGALVRGGNVYVYPKYATSQLLYGFERLAKEEGLGLWGLSESERVRPWNWRKQNR